MSQPEDLGALGLACGETAAMLRARGLHMKDAAATAFAELRRKVVEGYGAEVWQDVCARLADGETVALYSALTELAIAELERSEKKAKLQLVKGGT